jgi:hypothetical protein
MATVGGGGGDKPKKLPPQRTAGMPLPYAPVGGRAARVEADIGPPKGGRGRSPNAYPTKNPPRRAVGSPDLPTTPDMTEPYFPPVPMPNATKKKPTARRT